MPNPIARSEICPVIADYVIKPAHTSNYQINDRFRNAAINQTFLKISAFKHWFE